MDRSKKRDKSKGHYKKKIGEVHLGAQWDG